MVRVVKFLVALGATLLLTSTALADEPPEKLPAPSAEAQAASLKTIKEAFKKDYAKPTDIDAAALAKKLFDAALETKGEPTDRFVLLSESREAAVRGGDVAATIRAIDQLSSEFAVDPLPMKEKSLAAIAKTTIVPSANATLAEALLATVDEATAADDYKTAARLLAAAKPVARKAEKTAITTKIDRVAKELPILQKQYDAVQAAFEKLKRSPDDADANLAVGKFLCFWSGKWDSGLPMLAKGSDGKLKAIGALEVTNPQELTDQMKLGDFWWAQADSEGEPAKTRLRQMAVAWYNQALPRLSGFSKAKVEKRVNEVENATASGWKDVTGKVDPSSNANKGSWYRKDSGVASRDGTDSQIIVPVALKRDYQLEFAFTPLNRAGEISTIIPVGGRYCMVVINCAGAVSGVQWISGNDVLHNSTQVRTAIEGNRKYTLRVSVAVEETSDTATIAVDLDGKPCSKYRGAVSTLHMPGSWPPPEKPMALLRSLGSEVLFQRVRIAQ